MLGLDYQQKKKIVYSTASKPALQPTPAPFQ
jgi:hypothetical protein